MERSRNGIELPLVSDLAQEFLAGGDVRRAFDCLGRCTVDYAQYAASLLGLGHDDFDRVGAGAEDRAHFRNVLHGVEQVDGIGLAKNEYEHMPGGERLRVADGGAAEFVVVAVGAREAGAGGFVEGQAELGLRDGVDHGLVHVLDRLDEVSLAEDDVGVGRNLQANGFKLEHDGLLRLARAAMIAQGGLLAAQAPNLRLPNGSGGQQKCNRLCYLRSRASCTALRRSTTAAAV